MKAIVYYAERNENNFLRVEDLMAGEIFTFLSGDYKNKVCLKTDFEDSSVVLESGEFLDDSCCFDYNHLPIKRLRCTIKAEEIE